MVTEDREHPWGIIRYAVSSGTIGPETDACAFDGWYLDRNEAEEIQKDWIKRYPGWCVALIQLNQITGRGDFTNFTNKPLTFREWKFVHGEENFEI